MTTANTSLNESLDRNRKVLHGTRTRAYRAQIGQFFTPSPIARFMASLFERQWQRVRILDAGAGGGALFAALVEELCAREETPREIEVVAFEKDASLMARLEETMRLCRSDCARKGVAFRGEAICDDFIAAAVARLGEDLLGGVGQLFTHAILNPPYKKINGETETRQLLDAAGMPTTNLYAAFVWLSTRLLEKGGELVSPSRREVSAMAPISALTAGRCLTW